MDDFGSGYSFLGI